MNYNKLYSLPKIYKEGTTKNDWEKKIRPTLLNTFADEIYGVIPENEIKVTTRLTYEESGLMGGNATRKTIEITAERNGNSMSFPFVLFVPTKKDTKVGAFITICNKGMEAVDPYRSFIDPFWPAENIISRGWATGAMITRDIAPDYWEGFTTRFHKLFSEKRKGNSYGTIAAWSWGVSRIMDYLCKDKDIDENKVIVVGHSRGGKTALWTAARDSRFAMVISSSSGCTGAAPSRIKTGEHIADINTRFPYWFCENYKKYNDNENKLPVDQHMLLATIAPRPVYVSSKTMDDWADPESEFTGCLYANTAYELYGRIGIAIKKMPLPETPTMQGQIGYHLMTGVHAMTAYDWERYLDFADLKLNK